MTNRGTSGPACHPLSSSEAARLYFTVLTGLFCDTYSTNYNDFLLFRVLGN